MNDIQLLPVGGDLFYTPNFAAEVPSSASVTGIAFSATPSLTLQDQTNDLANSQASIRVSGAAHGVHYVLKAVATLDNNETLPKSISLVGFNG